MPFPPSYYQMFLFDDRFHRHKNPLRLYFVETSLNGNANQIIFSWLNAIIYRCGVKTIHAIAWQEVVCGREVPFSQAAGWTGCQDLLPIGCMHKI